MPWCFLFGGKKTKEEPRVAKADDGELSEVGTLEDLIFTEEPVNEVYFMNPGFGSSASFRSQSISPVPGLAYRQHTRRLSSRMRDYKRLASVDASEYDVDVALAQSAFALQMIPNGAANNSFCSRDDSEIATRTLMSPTDPFRRSSIIKSPHVNAMFLHDTYSVDDSDVGSMTNEKIRLRHMGSALSYRLELSGTPDYSVYGDDESIASKGHSRRYSDVSERLTSFKERNKMIRLESLVGGIQKQEGSVFEFGVVDPDQFMNQPTPRLFRSASETLLPSSNKPNGTEEKKPQMHQLSMLLDNQRLESYPISFLKDIIEEDEDSTVLDVIAEDAQGKLAQDDDDEEMAENDNGVEAKEEEVESLSSLSSLSSPDRKEIARSSFKVRVAPFEFKEEDGFKNPAFETEIRPSPDEEPWSSPRRAAESSEKKPLLRLESLKRTPKEPKAKKEKRRHAAPKPPKEKRDESLHLALMERYLVQSVVNKYLIE